MKDLLTREQVMSARALIERARRVVIVTHMSPDGDAMGSSMGMWYYLTGLGKEARVVVPNMFPDFLKWMPGASEILVYETQSCQVDELLQAADLVVCTDFNEPKRIGVLGEKLLALSAPKLLIDHHLHPMPFADVAISYPELPASCEIVYRLVSQLREVLPMAADRRLDFATCIYTGMMTDTGNFSYNSNHPETYEIIGQLVQEGIDKDMIYNAVFNAYSADRMRLLGYCLYQKMRIFPEHHTALIYLSRKELYRFNFQSGDAEGIVNMPLQIKDIYYSCFMREDKVSAAEVALANGSKNKIKISLRSQGDRPVNIFAHDVFSGGGHANASGGEYYGPLAEAVQRFLDKYKAYFVD